MSEKVDLSQQPNLEVRPLVVGAQGLVGQALTEYLEERYPHTVSATRTELDITDRWRTAAELERLQPTVVINCAASSHVDACETDPEKADEINCKGPFHLATACRHLGARLIHLSTDYVFDGEKGSEYTESDAPNPVNVYGTSKANGEQAVLDELVDVVVLRVAFVFGRGRDTFLDQIVRKVLDGDEVIRAVDGWTTRPTALETIIDGIERLLLSSHTGIWHLASHGTVTRFDFARTVVELAGGDPGRVEAQDASELRLAAQRPSATPLGTGAFERAFGVVPRSWVDHAAEYINARYGLGPGRRAGSS